MSAYLDGRVAVVTGAGRGVGRSHALTLARLGACVVVNDLGVEADGTAPSPETAARVVQEIAAAGGRAAASCDDVATAGGAQALVDKAIEAFGRLDIVVNNAGIVLPGPFLDLEPAQIETVIDVNLLATLLVTRAAGRYWRSQSDAGVRQDARVISTTSAGGLYGFVMAAAYAAGKGGVLSFSSTMAQELRPYGVTVNVIGPTATTRNTTGLDMALVGANLEIDREGLTEADFDPAFISPLVAWLAGPDAANVSGRVFEIGGGRIYIDDGWHRHELIEHERDTDVRRLGEDVAKALKRMPDAVPPVGFGGYSLELARQAARLTRAPAYR